MDLQAFKQHILPVRDKLFRLAKNFLRNREEAEDLLQDVLLKLWTNKQDLDTYKSVEALAMTTTRNLCLDRLKARKYRRTADIDGCEIDSGYAAPDQLTEAADSESLLQRLLDALPEQQRYVLHLREVEGYSYEEMEELTGLSANNLRVILSRARKSMRDGYLKVEAYGAN
ncbi:sigma-70 family RNA polymerase sigma factor [soil metagenome]